MKPDTLEVVIWVLIYGGLLLLVLGLFLLRRGADFGGPCVVGGAGLAVLGVLLIWIRSRMDR